jgi:hypothetical protein
VTPSTLTPAAGLLEGERQKLAAHHLLEEARESHLLRARRALLHRLLEAGSATVDAVRAAVALPLTLNPKLFGAVPGPLAEAGIIAPGGFARSCRPETHARPVTRWLLADRAAAVAWLSANPEPPAEGVGNPSQRDLFG